MKNIILLFLICLAIGFSACNDKWDEHNEINDSSLKEDLFQKINENPDLSTFSSYLTKTGYDVELKSSKLYTVWAPTNQALEGIDQSIVEDNSKLKQFVENHISYQQYYTYTPRTDGLIKMVSGKNIVWPVRSTTIDQAEITSADQVYRNGVLHIINHLIEVKVSAWDYLMANNSSTRQKEFINKLEYYLFDPTKAKQTGVDDQTGLPIYEPGSGLIWNNKFLNNVRNIKDEDSLSTFFILTDDALESEVNKLKPFFETVTMDADSTDSLARWNVVKDLAIKGLYTPDNLPDTLVSRFNVRVPIDKSAIVETRRVSNGIVYVMSKMDFKVSDKIAPIYIEGESARRPVDFSRSDKNDRIHYRLRDWARGGFDLRVWDHGIARIWVKYRIALPKGNYKVYWRVVNDVTRVNFSQRLAFGDPNSTSEASYPYQVITPLNLSKTPAEQPADRKETLLPFTYTASSYGYVDIYVVGANNTTRDTNPIFLDYIKLEPVLQ